MAPALSIGTCMTTVSIPMLTLRAGITALIPGHGLMLTVPRGGPTVIILGDGAVRTGDGTCRGIPVSTVRRASGEDPDDGRPIITAYATGIAGHGILPVVRLRAMERDGIPVRERHPALACPADRHRRRRVPRDPA